MIGNLAASHEHFVPPNIRSIRYGRVRRSQFNGIGSAPSRESEWANLLSIGVGVKTNHGKIFRQFISRFSQCSLMCEGITSLKDLNDIQDLSFTHIQKYLLSIFLLLYRSKHRAFKSLIEFFRSNSSYSFFELRQSFVRIF